METAIYLYLSIYTHTYIYVFLKKQNDTYKFLEDHTCFNFHWYIFSSSVFFNVYRF